MSALLEEWLTRLGQAEILELMHHLFAGSASV
jgi:hypothetical protein